MKLTDIGYVWETMGMPCGESAPKGKGKKEPKKDYPVLFIRSKGELPELPVDEEGCGYATIKFKVVGQSERTSQRGDDEPTTEATLELEVRGIASAEEVEMDDEGEESESEGGISEAFDEIAASEVEEDEYEGEEDETEKEKA